MIVQLLRQKQDKLGYLRDEDLEEVARIASVPRYRVEEVATFFPHFRLWRPPDVVVQVCRDMACHLRQASVLAEGISKKLKENGFAAEFAFPNEAQGSTDGVDSLNRPPNGSKREEPHAGKEQAPSIRIEGISCLGRCDRAPVMCVSRHVEEADQKSAAVAIHENIYVGTANKPLEQIVVSIAKGNNPPDEKGKGETKGTIDPLLVPDLDAINPERPNVDGWKINPYSASADLPHYAAVRKFMAECKKVLVPRGWTASLRDFSAPSVVVEAWLQALIDSFLLGMGGAGERAGRKWRDVSRQTESVKYIVANGDESEPGTFKDRELMLQLPHLLVEGVILAGLLTGATRAYIFIRHEYQEQIEKLRAEINTAEQVYRVCGNNILDTDRCFPVEVFVSPGGYICGEQTALIEAIEDHRAQPRNRPPELGANGLFDMPTLVNNIETLAWAPAIFLNGAPWYRDQGGEPRWSKSKGWRLFSISGDVVKPGVFEMPVGAALGDLIDRAGGVIGGKSKLRGVATSGPSAGFLPAEWKIPAELDRAKERDNAVAKAKKDAASDPLWKDPELADQLRLFAAEQLDDINKKVLDITTLPLDLNFFRGGAASLAGIPGGLNLGAGIVIYADGADMHKAAVNATEFFRNESCGKCVPCRIGSEKLVQIGLSLTDNQEAKDDVKLLDDVLSNTSICGLGPSAPKPLKSWLVFFDPNRRAR